VTIAYLAFDPGEMVGWAHFNEEGKVVSAGQVTWIDLTDWLETQNASLIKKVVIEEYKVFHHKAKAHIGSKIETVQTIGMIKAWCIRNKVSYVEQPASILNIAEKWTQIKMPSNHAYSHQISATLHGYYWLIKEGLSKTALEFEHEKRIKNKERS
jgi:hypothetical protein